MQAPAVAQVYTTAVTGGNGFVTLSTAKVVTKQCTHSAHDFTIPAHVAQLQVIAVGGQGGSGSHTGQPGFGAQVTATIHLHGQKKLTYYVGCDQGGAGGFGYGNGGYQGTSGPFYSGEGGGGGTAVLDGNNPLVVAGGGGGPGGNANGNGGNGGNAGYGPGVAGAGRGGDGSGSSPGSGGQGGANNNISGQSGADGGYGGAGGGGGGYTPPPNPEAEPGGGGLQGTNGSPEAGGGGGGGAGASYARPGATTAVTYDVSLHPGSGFLTFIYQQRVPTQVTAVSGANQHTVVDTPFPLPLSAKVTDNNGRPVPNAAVRFDVGSGTGPGGTFAGGARSETELTNSDGVATSSPLVANSTAGAWSAKASVGALSTRFPLYNDLRTTTAVSSSANPSVPGQSVRFRAKVTTAPGAGTPTGTVQFSVDGSNLGGAVPLDDGVATSPSTAALTPGGHTVKASYSGSPGYGPASGVLTQIVKATIPVACDPSSLTSTLPPRRPTRFFRSAPAVSTP